MQYLVFTTGQVYVAVVVSLSCNYATIPLFFEVGEDLAYPVPEILVSSVITAADNICTVIYLFISSIPNIGEKREEKGGGKHRHRGRNTNGQTRRQMEWDRERENKYLYTI